MPKKNPSKEISIDSIYWGIFDFDEQKLPGYGLGSTDSIFTVTDFPIYKIDSSNPNCLFYRFQERLQKIQQKQKPLDMDMIYEFDNLYPHLYLELIIFEGILPEVYYFHYRKKLYCYSTDIEPSKVTKEDPFFKLRFLFNPFKILNLSTD